MLRVPKLTPCRAELGSGKEGRATFTLHRGHRSQVQGMPSPHHLAETSPDFSRSAESRPDHLPSKLSSRGPLPTSRRRWRPSRPTPCSASTTNPHPRQLQDYGRSRWTHQRVLRSSDPSRRRDEDLQSVPHDSAIFMSFAVEPQPHKLSRGACDAEEEVLRGLGEGRGGCRAVSRLRGRMYIAVVIIIASSASRELCETCAKEASARRAPTSSPRSLSSAQIVERELPTVYRSILLSNIKLSTTSPPYMPAVGAQNVSCRSRFVGLAAELSLSLQSTKDSRSFFRTSSTMASASSSALVKLS